MFATAVFAMSAQSRESLAHPTQTSAVPMNSLRAPRRSGKRLSAFGNATLIVSMPVASPERKRLNPLAIHYVQRAGHLYSWSLRLFLMVVPVVAGIVHPLSMLPATVALMAALRFFDQPTPVEIARIAVVPSAFMLAKARGLTRSRPTWVHLEGCARVASQPGVAHSGCFRRFAASFIESPTGASNRRCGPLIAAGNQAAAASLVLA
jgi:hypothetical protein